MSQLEPLIDTFGKVHNNLQIRVTDRCNIRYFYYMPEDNPVSGGSGSSPRSAGHFA